MRKTRQAAQLIIITVKVNREGEGCVQGGREGQREVEQRVAAKGGQSRLQLNFSGHEDFP